MYLQKETIQAFFKLLNQGKIEYLLIKNIADELPAKLMVNKDIDILVSEASLKNFDYIMKKNKFIQLIHPKGRENGWNYLYNMPECVMYKNLKSGLEVDVTTILCTKSVNMNAWIPLDKIINESVWKEREWDEDNSWWKMDDKNLVVYLIVRAVFEKNQFSDTYIYEIEKRKEYLYTEDCKKKLKCVFFSYTDTLLNLIKDNNYKSIIPSYMTFCQY